MNETSDLFVNPPPIVICGICLDVLKDAVVSCARGHVYCRACITQWLNTSRKCPTCRETAYGSLAPARHAIEMVEQLERKCRYLDCKWTGSKNELKEHTSRCEYIPVECSHVQCIYMVPKLYLSVHEQICDKKCDPEELEHLVVALLNEDPVPQKLLLKAAKLGSARAQWYLGKKDLQQPFNEWLIRAAEQGWCEAQMELAQRYEMVQNVDECKVFYWYEKASERSVDAKQILAERYWEGKGTARDRTKAISYATLAAKEGNSEAHFLLGKWHSDSTQPEYDLERACQYLETIANHGHLEAQLLLVRIYTDTHAHERRAHFLKCAAESGNSDAEYELGLCYVDGKGVVQDEKEATKWFRLAAMNDHMNALYEYGYRLEYGRGVCLDVEDDWILYYRKAAYKGHKKAQLRMGQYFLNTQRNQIGAIQFFSMAAEQGCVHSQIQLGNMYLDNGSITMSRKYFQMAADQGYTGAEFMMACFSFADRRFSKALEQLQSVAKKGYPNAYIVLAEMYRTGTGVEKDSEKALDYYRLANEPSQGSGLFSVSSYLHLVERTYQDGKYGASLGSAEEDTGLDSHKQREERKAQEEIAYAEWFLSFDRLL